MNGEPTRTPDPPDDLDLLMGVGAEPPPEPEPITAKPQRLATPLARMLEAVSRVPVPGQAAGLLVRAFEPASERSRIEAGATRPTLERKPTPEEKKRRKQMERAWRQWETASTSVAPAGVDPAFHEAKRTERMEVARQRLVADFGIDPEERHAAAAKYEEANPDILRSVGGRLLQQAEGEQDPRYMYGNNLLRAAQLLEGYKASREDAGFVQSLAAKSFGGYLAPFYNPEMQARDEILTMLKDGDLPSPEEFAALAEGVGLKVEQPLEVRDPNKFTIGEMGKYLLADLPLYAAGVGLEQAAFRGAAGAAARMGASPGTTRFLQFLGREVPTREFLGEAAGTISRRGMAYMAGREAILTGPTGIILDTGRALEEGIPVPIAVGLGTVFGTLAGGLGGALAYPTIAAGAPIRAAAGALLGNTTRQLTALTELAGLGAANEVRLWFTKMGLADEAAAEAATAWTPGTRAWLRQQLEVARSHEAIEASRRAVETPVGRVQLEKPLDELASEAGAIDWTPQRPSEERLGVLARHYAGISPESRRRAVDWAKHLVAETAFAGGAAAAVARFAPEFTFTGEDGQPQVDLPMVSAMALLLPWLGGRPSRTQLTDMVLHELKPQNITLGDVRYPVSPAATVQHKAIAGVRIMRWGTSTIDVDDPLAADALRAQRQHWLIVPREDAKLYTYEMDDMVSDQAEFATVDADDIYDIGADRHGIIRSLKRDLGNRTPSPQEVESALLSADFIGYFNSKSSLPNAVTFVSPQTPAWIIQDAHARSVGWAAIDFTDSPDPAMNNLWLLEPDEQLSITNELVERVVQPLLQRAGVSDEARAGFAAYWRKAQGSVVPVTQPVVTADALPADMPAQQVRSILDGISRAITTNRWSAARPKAGTGRYALEFGFDDVTLDAGMIEIITRLLADPKSRPTRGAGVGFRPFTNDDIRGLVWHPTGDNRIQLILPERLSDRASVQAAVEQLTSLLTGSSQTHGGVEVGPFAGSTLRAQVYEVELLEGFDADAFAGVGGGGLSQVAEGVDTAVREAFMDISKKVRQRVDEERVTYTPIATRRLVARAGTRRERAYAIWQSSHSVEADIHDEPTGLIINYHGSRDRDVLTTVTASDGARIPVEGIVAHTSVQSRVAGIPEYGSGSAPSSLEWMNELLGAAGLPRSDPSLPSAPVLRNIPDWIGGQIYFTPGGTEGRAATQRATAVLRDLYPDLHSFTGTRVTGKQKEYDRQFGHNGYLTKFFPPDSGPTKRTVTRDDPEVIATAEDMASRWRTWNGYHAQLPAYIAANGPYADEAALERGIVEFWRDRIVHEVGISSGARPKTGHMEPLTKAGQAHVANEKQRLVTAYEAAKAVMKAQAPKAEEFLDRHNVNTVLANASTTAVGFTDARTGAQVQVRLMKTGSDIELAGEVIGATGPVSSQSLHEVLFAVSARVLAGPNDGPMPTTVSLDLSALQAPIGPGGLRERLRQVDLSAVAMDADVTVVDHAVNPVRHLREVEDTAGGVGWYTQSFRLTDGREIDVTVRRVEDMGYGAWTPQSNDRFHTYIEDVGGPDGEAMDWTPFDLADGNPLGDELQNLLQAISTAERASGATSVQFDHTYLGTTGIGNQYRLNEELDEVGRPALLSSAAPLALLGLQYLDEDEQQQPVAEAGLGKGLAIAGLGAGLAVLAGRAIKRLPGLRRLADPLEEAVNLATLPAHSRAIQQHISVGGQHFVPRTAASIEESVLDLYTRVVRRTARLESLKHEAERVAGEKLPIAIDPEATARLLHGATRRAEGFLEIGPMLWTPDGNVRMTGELPFEAILQNLQGDLNAFRRYEIAMRSREVTPRGIDTGIDMVDAEREVLSAKAKVKQAHVDAVKFRHAVLRYVKEAGGVDPQVFKLLRELGKAYVPLQRVFEGKDPYAKGGVGRAERVARVLRRLVGSKRPIVDPIETTVEYTRRMIRAADMMRVAQSLVELAETYPKFAEGLIEKVGGAGSKAITEHAVRLKEAAERRGITMTEQQAEAIATLLADRGLVAADDLISVWRNGQLEQWRVSGMAKEALRALNPQHIPLWAKIVGFPAQAMKSGITLAYAFQAFNFIRDTFDATLQSRYGFRLGYDSFKGFYESAKANWRGKRSADYTAFVLGGGGFATLRGAERRSVQKELQRILPEPVWREALGRLGAPAAGAALGAVVAPEGEEAKGAAFGAALGVPMALPRKAKVWHPLQALKEFGQPFEEAARVGEFMRALDAKASVMDAVLASQDVTVDFLQAGSDMAALSYMTAFMNPAVQSLDRFVRTMGRPFGDFATVRRQGGTKGEAAAAAAEASKVYLLGATTIALPSAILWAVEEMTDDQEVRDLRQSESGLIYWHVRNPWTKEIMRLPKPFVWGQVFGTGMEAALDSFKQSDPEAARRFAQGVGEQMFFTMVPNAVQIWYAQKLNRDLFFDQPIVPPGLESLWDRSWQFKAHTTAVARRLGELAREVPWTEGRGVSPARIDKMVRDLSGSLGADVMRLTDEVLRKYDTEHPEAPEKVRSDWAAIGRLFARYPNLGVAPVRRFYEEYEKVEGMQRNVNLAMRRRDGPSAQELRQRFRHELMYRPILQAHAQWLQNMSQDITVIVNAPRSSRLSPEKKRELLDRNQRLMIDRTRRLLEQFDRNRRDVEESTEQVDDLFAPAVPTAPPAVDLQQLLEEPARR
jgi:hypothetical protein